MTFISLRILGVANTCTNQDSNDVLHPLFHDLITTPPPLVPRIAAMNRTFLKVPSRPLWHEGELVRAAPGNGA